MGHYRARTKSVPPLNILCCTQQNLIIDNLLSENSSKLLRKSLTAFLISVAVQESNKRSGSQREREIAEFPYCQSHRLSDNDCTASTNLFIKKRLFVARLAALIGINSTNFIALLTPISSRLKTIFKQQAFSKKAGSRGGYSTTMTFQF